MKTIWLAAAACCWLGTTGAAASSPRPLMARLDAVMGHIQDAYKSGDLTRSESDGLKNQFQTILAVERRYAATQGLDSWERQDLKQMLDQLEARLRREMQDDQRRS